MNVDRQQMLDLFLAARDGSEMAFRELHSQLARPLMAYCLSFTRDVEAAKDLFQQVMMSVYEARHRFSSGNFLGWVFTIARNACRNWETHNKRYRPLEEAGPLINDTPRPLEYDEIEMVQQAILQLPEEFRSVVLMRYFGDASVEMIAQAENISESLVKVRLYRARKSLEKILRPIMGHEHENA